MKTNRKIFALLLVALQMFLLSCHESDIEMDYAIDDIRNYEKANTTLEGQFEAIWRALNFNYPMWDYEAEYGVDWDEVHAKYIQEFHDLDLKYSKDYPIPDSKLLNRYNAIMNLLHDGHTTLNLKNIHTGFTVWNFYPNPDISHHINRFITILGSNSDSASGFSPSINWYKEKGYVSDYDQALAKNNNKFKYEKYALFDHNIAYYYLSDFFLDPNNYSRINVWKSWFDKIQELKRNGLLKGVIIDLRNNCGGNPECYQYVLGSLQPTDIDSNNRFHIGYIRFKTGIGRLDFSGTYDYTLPIYPETHYHITEPIVILADSLTRSAAELTCLAAKQIDNVCIIGTTTWGGYSGIMNDSIKNTNFVRFGNVGDRSLDKVSFFLQMPAYTFMTKDHKIIEGKGIKPDIEIVLDRDLLKREERDNQIERALEYIRTGK